MDLEIFLLKFGMFLVEFFFKKPISTYLEMDSVYTSVLQFYTDPTPHLTPTLTSIFSVCYLEIRIMDLETLF